MRVRKPADQYIRDSVCKYWPDEGFLSVTSITRMSSALLNMPSAPSSPASPSYPKRYRQSNSDLSSASPSLYASNGRNPSKRSSRTSVTISPQSSPLTARSHSFQLQKSRSISISSQQDIQSGGVFGNLADELYGVWDEDDKDGQEGSFLNGLREDSVEAEPASEPNRTVDQEILQGPEFGVASSSAFSEDYHADILLHPEAADFPLDGMPKSTRHERTAPLSDAGDYGSNVIGSDKFPPGLSNRILDIESLAETTNSCLDRGGAVIARTTDSLEDLSSQSSIENGVSRLIAAYTSMAMHRTLKSRELFTHSQSLLFSPYQNLPSEILDMLLSCVGDLLETTSPNQGQHHSFVSLRSLIANTVDLTHSLQSVSDVLQESRIITSMSGRKLKSVKDLVAEIRLEEEAGEQGIKWIESGNWNHRLQIREAQQVCWEVVVGFEKTCDMWRNRLLGGLGEAAA